ncbi:MAG: NAD(P)H-dependent oxidoreductase [Burkholderiales bacterium]|nr:NAD(P)H-dependent oxidoreductase [Burkholderiales bacterium]
MNGKPKILAFSGSARTGSLNQKLAAVAARAVEAAGGEVTLINLRDYPIPLYDGDLETAHGIPENARALKTLFKAHQGLLISSPENNASVSALLKNTLDWISRQDGAESGLVPYQGKVAGLLAASPGNFGGIRGLPHLRAICQTLGVLVLPNQVAVTQAAKAFSADGELVDERHRAAVKGLAERLVDACRRLGEPLST